MSEQIPKDPNVPRSNPEIYRAMAEPYDSVEEATAALNRFYEELYDLRIRHRIPEVFSVAMTYAKGGLGVPHVFHIGSQLRMQDLATLGMREARLQTAELMRMEAEASRARAEDLEEEAARLEALARSTTTPLGKEVEISKNLSRPSGAAPAADAPFGPPQPLTDPEEIESPAPPKEPFSLAPCVVCGGPEIAEPHKLDLCGGHTYQPAPRRAAEEKGDG